MDWLVQLAASACIASSGIALLAHTNRAAAMGERLASFGGGIALTAAGAGTIIADIRPTVEGAGRMIVRHLPDVLPAALGAPG
ncbi:hypothetical protein C882_0408 [Caenispirillum salinarum AK4]|uniref:Uncharacterized protein n=1 Tax=Caenispirillum salinarum AK4 TaxID=1238182 RepID=K9HM16_9PROT|nr:hypothetical protein [Caenispirillum salinarum]EKV29586.1 hypothetical protein C882_0408 [Caenispirillum salinarum AK4]